MAKKKQKKAKEGKEPKTAKAGTGKAKAADAGKLPKRIAGVKVPKALRDSGGKLMEVARHPLVMDAAAAALIAAAAKLREGSGKRRAAEPGPVKSADLGAILTATAVEGVRKIAEAARTGAKGNGKSGNEGGGGV